MVRPAHQPVHVFKFGGTSVATPERIRHVVRLIEAEPATALRVVVVSALGGVTDRLLEAVEEALERTGRHRDVLDELRERHWAAAEVLARPEEHAGLLACMEARWQELTELLDGLYLLRECTLRSRDTILSVGERVSAPLMAAALRAAGIDAAAHEAPRFIRTDDAFGEANVQFAVTNELVQAYFERVSPEQVAVVTGFIAATEGGVITTLGRSGSDYTATILAGALDAERVVIWTDVDGVLSADPRLVPEAFSLPYLTYQEAAELAYFGAKVLHPRTMRPLKERGIPLLIKNTLNPAAPGTRIERTASDRKGHVEGVTSIRNMAMVILEGTGMMGVPGISARAFGALAAEQINVLMISQASSEQSICIVVRNEERERAVRAIEQAFELERARGDVSGVSALEKVAILSLVGDNMRYRPGMAGRMFDTLGRGGINVLAIAEGASDTNISAVVDDAEVKWAVQALHEAFSLGRERVHLFLIGTGTIGTMLLQMLAERAPELLARMNLNLQLVGLANTRHMLWSVDGIPFGEAPARLAAAPGAPDLDTILQHLVQSRLERLIVIDATASDEVAHRYPELLEHNIAVITPNKRANTKDQAFYDRLHEAVRRHQIPYFYETTVGAGLPIVSTLRDLVRTGDRIHRVEGVLSGTLAFIFNQLADGRTFSETVRLARAEGFTEPDPRDDLKGEDVARKLLILAREAGLRVERSDVAVESLVPAHLFDVSVEAFMDRLEELDAAWHERMRAAEDGMCLHYIGVIEEGRLNVRVRAVDAASPFAHLRGTDNMVVFTTERYHQTPLVIQGPGAGPAVTAAGILADVIKAAELVA